MCVCIYIYVCSAMSAAVIAKGLHLSGTFQHNRTTALLETVLSRNYAKPKTTTKQHVHRPQGKTHDQTESPATIRMWCPDFPQNMTAQQSVRRHDTCSGILCTRTWYRTSSSEGVWSWMVLIMSLIQSKVREYFTRKR